MQEKQSHPYIPWYKNHILLLIIFIPFATVCASMYTIYLAISSKDAPVLDGYYKTGVSPNKMNLNDQNIQSATLDPSRALLILKRTTPSKEPLTLTLEHPTIAASDRTYPLIASADNQYPLPQEILTHLKNQRWYLKLTSQTNPNWRLHAQSQNTTTPIVFHTP